MNEASDKGFFKHYFRLTCGKALIVFFSQAKFKFLGIMLILKTCPDLYKKMILL